MLLSTIDFTISSESVHKIKSLERLVKQGRYVDSRMAVRSKKKNKLLTFISFGIAYHMQVKLKANIFDSLAVKKK